MIIFKLAAREFRHNLKYWLFFLVNLVVGLIGFTFIFLFRENVSLSLQDRSTQLLSSDIAISGRRDLNKEEAASVMKFMEGKYTDYSRLLELYSMAKAPSSGKSRLTFVKFIEGTYPLRGKLELQKAGMASEVVISALNQQQSVWVSKEVAHQFKVGIGDTLRIGNSDFKVSDIIEADTTSSMRGFSLAPKVYVGRAFLEKTGLVRFGTVAWRTRFFNLKKNLSAKELKKEMEGMISDPAVKVRIPANSSENIARVIGYLSDFLGLIGVVALLMSSVGISYLYQGYVLDRLKHIGILKSLGLDRRQIVASFVLVILGIGMVGSGLTLFFADLLMPIGTHYLQQWFTGDFYRGLSWEVIGLVMSLALVINLLTCLPVLMFLFKEKTINLLNETVDGGVRPLYYIPGAVFLWGLSIWQAHSIIIGSVFFFALLFVFAIVMTLMPTLFKRSSRKLSFLPLVKPIGLEWGYATRIITRNRLTSLLMILSLAIGVTLISVIGQLDKSLKAELTGSNNTKPSLFLFDIQDDQVDDLIALAQKEKIPLKSPSPMVRARLLRKNGEAVKRQEKEGGFTTREQEQSRRFNNRGVNLSYAPELNDSEEMIKGKAFSGDYSGEGMAEVSLEKRYAQRLKVDVGDTLTYEVLGVEVQAKIVNLRKITWTSFLPNFFILFQPGVLEDAPKTFLSVVEKVSFDKQLAIQDLLVDKFPNVSIINVTELVTKILKLFDAMAWAIGIMSLCCIVVGLFVLYSILQSQLVRKQKELALQKLMGLSQVQALKIVVIEYSLLSLTAQLLGSAVGAGVAYVVSHIFLDGVYLFNWEFFLGFNLILYGLSLVTIFLTFKAHYGKNVKSLLLD